MDAVPMNIYQELPAYVELRRDVVINANLWSADARIISADFGFEGIVGVPGLETAADLQRAIMAGAGVNLDYVALNPVPPLRNLTAAIPAGAVPLAGYGAVVIRGDAIPVVFSWPVLPSSVSPTDIVVRLNTGQMVTPTAAAINPNHDYNERNVVVLFGEFGNRLSPGQPGAIYPVSVEVVADGTPMQLIGPNGPQSAIGLSAPSLNPYVAGPKLLAARLSRFSSVGDFGPALLTGGGVNDGASLYGGEAVYRLRLLTSGGFSPDGVTTINPTEFARFFRLEARDSAGRTVIIDRDGQTYDLGPGLGRVQVAGLAELGAAADGTTVVYGPYYREDKDNYIDIILTGDEAAIRSIVSVSLPTSAVDGYSDVYTPGGPGRTPTPGVVYTRPAQPQTIAVDFALDGPGTVSYAAQELARYDAADGLPVVFRLHHAGAADTVYTASSRQAAALIAQGYTEQGVPFSNEVNHLSRVVIREFVSASGGDRLYTADPAEIGRLRQAGSGYVERGPVFAGIGVPTPGAEPIHRFHSPVAGDRFYTPSLTEGFSRAGYLYEGVGWHAAALTPDFSRAVVFDRPDMLDFGGTMAGPATLTKRGAGTLVLSGVNTMTGATAVESGTLTVTGSLAGSTVTVARGATLGGTGIVGPINARGTVAPGPAIGTLAALGGVVFDAGSVLAMDVSPTAADRLAVAGGVTLNGGALRIDAQDGAYQLGAHYDLVTAAGGIAGSLSAVLPPASGLPDGIRFDVSYRAPDRLTLIVTPESYAGLHGLTANQRSVAQALDQRRPAAGSRGDGALAPLFDALYATTRDELPPALDQLAGGLHADAVSAAQDVGRLFGGALTDRTAMVRTDSLAASMQPLTALSLQSGGGAGPSAVTGNTAAQADQGPRLPPGTGSTVWTRALGRHADRRGDTAGGTGFVADTGGFVVGVDRRLASGADMGVALGHFRTDLESDRHGGDADIHSYGVGAYGAFPLGRSFIDASLAYMVSDHSSHRPIRLVAVEQVAKASSTGHTVSASLAVGHSWHWRGAIIEPSAALRYDRTIRDGFTESGTDGLGLAVDDTATGTARSSLGLRVTRRVDIGGVVVEPQFRARWDHDFLDQAATSRAMLAGGRFTVSGSKGGRDAALLGIGGAARLGDSLDGFAWYDAELRDRATAHVLSVGVRIRLP